MCLESFLENFKTSYKPFAKTTINWKISLNSMCAMHFYTFSNLGFSDNSQYRSYWNSLRLADPTKLSKKSAKKFTSMTKLPITTNEATTFSV